MGHEPVTSGVQTQCWNLLAFLDGSLSLDAFTRWLYETPLLEDQWGKDAYFALIDIDYGRTHAAQQARRLLAGIIGAADHEHWRLRTQLERVALDAPNGRSALRALYHAYCEGYRFLDNIALVWGLREVDTATGGDAPDDGPWTMPADARAEAARALKWLNTGQIVPTGARDRDGQLGFVDRRSSSERGPRTYRVGTAGSNAT